MTSPPEHRSDLQTHVVAERYRRDEKIGAGGMGTVWRGYDTVLKRHVAMKNITIPIGIPEPEAAVLRERSLREARAVAPIRHYNIVSVYDVVEESPHSFWIVTEYVDAENLSQRLRREGPLTPHETARIASQLLEALDAAHNIGVLHRDVKPANVLLTPGENGELRAVLTDFGIAQITTDPSLTRTGQLIGSPVYMPPERLLTTEPASEKTDLWALGCTLYAAVEGRLPFPYTDQLRAITAITVEPVPPAENAQTLTPVLTGLLQKDPQQRWSVAQTQCAIQDIVQRRAPAIENHWGAVTPQNSPQKPRRESTPLPAITPPPRSSRRKIALAAAAVLLCLVGIAAWQIPQWGIGAAGGNTGEWRTRGEEFTNTSYRLTHPETWESTCPHLTICSFTPPDTSSSPFQMLAITEQAQSAERATRREDRRNTALRGYEKSALEQRTFGGVQGWWLEYTFASYQDNEEVTRHIQVFRVDAPDVGGERGVVYALSLNGTLGVVEEYEYALRRAVTSLRTAS